MTPPYLDEDGATLPDSPGEGVDSNVPANEAPSTSQTGPEDISSHMENSFTRALTSDQNPSVPTSAELQAAADAIAERIAETKPSTEESASEAPDFTVEFEEPEADTGEQTMPIDVSREISQAADTLSLTPDVTVNLDSSPDDSTPGHEIKSGEYEVLEDTTSSDTPPSDAELAAFLDEDLASEEPTSDLATELGLETTTDLGEVITPITVEPDVMAAADALSSPTPAFESSPTTTSGTATFAPAPAPPAPSLDYRLQNALNKALNGHELSLEELELILKSVLTKTLSEDELLKRTQLLKAKIIEFVSNKINTDSNWKAYEQKLSLALSILDKSDNLEIQDIENTLSIVQSVKSSIFAKTLLPDIEVTSHPELSQKLTLLLRSQTEYLEASRNTRGILYSLRQAGSKISNFFSGPSYSDYENIGTLLREPDKNSTLDAITSGKRLRFNEASRQFMAKLVDEYLSHPKYTSLKEEEKNIYLKEVKKTCQLRLLKLTAETEQKRFNPDSNTTIGKVLSKIDNWTADKPYVKKAISTSMVLAAGGAGTALALSSPYVAAGAGVAVGGTMLIKGIKDYFSLDKKLNPVIKKDEEKATLFRRYKEISDNEASALLGRIIARDSLTIRPVREQSTQPSFYSNESELRSATIESPYQDFFNRNAATKEFATNTEANPNRTAILRTLIHNAQTDWTPDSNESPAQLKHRILHSLIQQNTRLSKDIDAGGRIERKNRLRMLIPFFGKLFS